MRRSEPSQRSRVPRGFSGDGGPAAEASIALANVQNECDPGTFEQGVHLAVDAAGNVLIADGNNHRILRISPQGLISTTAGSGERPETNARCEPTGSISGRLFNPADVAILPNGDLIISHQQNKRIRRVDRAGELTTVAGSGMHNLYAANIPATSSPMDWPNAVAVDAAGSIYFAEVHSHRVARIGSDGRIVTLAGTGFPGFGGDGAPAASARLNFPMGLALDNGGNVYIADRGNNRIQKVTPNGIITTVAGPERLNTPMDVKVDSAGNVYIADTLNHRVQRLNRFGANQLNRQS